MRIILILPFLAGVAACDVDSDSANDQVRIGYNEQKIEDAAAATARAAEEVGESVGNIAVDTGRAIEKEVGDIDVDVDVTRNRAQGATANEAAAN